MTYTPLLCQDLSRGLSRWFASRIDARWVVRRVCAAPDFESAHKVSASADCRPITSAMSGAIE